MRTAGRRGASSRGRQVGRAADGSALSVGDFKPRCDMLASETSARTGHPGQLVIDVADGERIYLAWARCPAHDVY